MSSPPEFITILTIDCACCTAGNGNLIASEGPQTLHTHKHPI